jgi:hemerythrin-like domain-containing protein
MCEYCGCQEVPAIAQLTNEHDAVVNLIGEVRAAVERTRLDEAAHGCRRILDILGPHTRVEEEALFPPMRDEFPDQIDALLAEHSSIEAVLAAASTGTPVDPRWPRQLLDSLNHLREHILKEQDGVFPASLAVLAPHDWDRLDEVRQAEAGLRPSAPRAAP